MEKEDFLYYRPYGEEKENLCFDEHACVVEKLRYGEEKTFICPPNEKPATLTRVIRSKDVSIRRNL